MANYLHIFYICRLVYYNNKMFSEQCLQSNIFSGAEQVILWLCPPLAGWWVMLSPTLVVMQ